MVDFANRPTGKLVTLQGCKMEENNMVANSTEEPGGVCDSLNSMTSTGLFGLANRAFYSNPDCSNYFGSS